jgi:hypothetical protein
MFPIVGFLAWQILGVVGSQIEIKSIFSLVGVLINFKRCHLQTENLKKLIFANKNWLNNPRIGCKSPSNLVDSLKGYRSRRGVRRVWRRIWKGWSCWNVKLIKILFSVKKLFVTMFVIFSLVRKIIILIFFKD